MSRFYITIVLTMVLIIGFSIGQIYQQEVTYRSERSCAMENQALREKLDSCMSENRMMKRIINEFKNSKPN